MSNESKTNAEVNGSEPFAEAPCYATGYGYADGVKDGERNHYYPLCWRYGLGTPERARWREAYERGWNAGNARWHNVPR